MTIRPTGEDMQKLYADAENTWTPAFVRLIKVSIANTVDSLSDWHAGRQKSRAASGYRGSRYDA